MSTLLTVVWLLLVVVVSLTLGFHIGRIRKMTVWTLGFPVLRFRVTFRPYDHAWTVNARHVAFEVSTRLDANNYHRLYIILFFDATNYGIRFFHDCFPYISRGKGKLAQNVGFQTSYLLVNLFSQNDLFPGLYSKLAKKRIAREYSDHARESIEASVEREYSNQVNASFLGNPKGSVSFPLLASILFYSGLALLVYVWLSFIPSGMLRAILPW